MSNTPATPSSKLKNLKLSTPSPKKVPRVRSCSSDISSNISSVPSSDEEQPSPSKKAKLEKKLAKPDSKDDDEEDIKPSPKKKGRAGSVRQPSQLTEDEWDTVDRLVAEGSSYATIARKLHVNTANQALKKNHARRLARGFEWTPQKLEQLAKLLPSVMRKLATDVGVPILAVKKLLVESDQIAKCQVNPA